ncbi:hypothetical protein AMS68_004246 [Peltaster fructicola]|uniref:Tryptophan synthase beta chain-like PALP domain-containing protein n=1 Tax=Peltaster fructicola TaxID=286661 RepID=A0A6H0XVT3_9PEZI|nr:hypothetical protein AMS68_004246 [Peltaster fructicola]
MSFTYTVEHVSDEKTTTRPSTFSNPHLNPSAIKYTLDPQVERFHRSLPDTNETKLHSLPAIAAELGFAHVFVKDESQRFGLPSFKPTGASWAVYKTLCQRTKLSTDVPIEQLKKALSRETDIKLVTCTAGNWGRAVSRIATLLDVKATVYVFGAAPESTQNLIRKDGGIVKYIPGVPYDEVLALAAAEAQDTGAMLIVDVNVEGCGDVPRTSLLAPTSGEGGRRRTRSSGIDQGSAP